MQPVPTKTQAPPALASRPTHVRHVVLGLTVAAYMITYMDRQVLAVARPAIHEELGISLVMMGMDHLRLPHRLRTVPDPRRLAGRSLRRTARPHRRRHLVEHLHRPHRPGVERGLHARIQVFFGLGEAGAFPIATRSLARWMRPTERGFAQGITHAGSRLGAALTPPIVVLIIAKFGWRAAPSWCSALGVVWSIVWFSTIATRPEEHKGVNQAERDLDRLRPQTAPTDVPWRKILAHGNLWILAVMYFCYNFNLNVYQDWFPTYLHDSRGMTLAKMGIYASLPLFAGTLGDLAGGWFSDLVLKRTGNVNLARRWVAIAGFLLSAAATIPAIFAHDPRVSVAFYCVAFFGLEWTVGISWAIPLDIGGDFAGSVSAVMNTLGNIGGALSAIVVTTAVSYFDWNAPFLITSAMCVIAAILFLKIDARQTHRMKCIK